MTSLTLLSSVFLISPTLAMSFPDQNNNLVDDRIEELVRIIYTDDEKILTVFQAQRAFIASFDTAQFLFDNRYKNQVNERNPESSIHQIASQIAQNQQDLTIFNTSVSLMASSLACIDFLLQKKNIPPDSDMALDFKKTARAKPLDKETLKRSERYAQYMNLLSKSPSLSPFVAQVFKNLNEQNISSFCNSILDGQFYSIRKFN